MKRNFTYKYLISLFIILCGICVFAHQSKVTFVSLSPALTEIMYAINAQDSLVGVSTACTYPKSAMLKEKVGDNYFVNAEKILKLKPTYILALDSSEFALHKFKKFGITPLCLKNPNIESIHNNILTIGKLTNREKNAKILVKNSKQHIKQVRTNNSKKILYLIQTRPMITIGKKSFLTDIIAKSGNTSVTKDINTFYPTISEEYAISKRPDIIVVGFYSDNERIKKIFPKSKIVTISKEDNDIINRPGARVCKSVEIFANISKRY